MPKITILIVTFLILIGGVLFLQVFLSKKENKWVGLILPSITFLFSILAVLGNTMFTTTQMVQDGKAIMSSVNNYPLGSILTALYIFVLYNIITVILVGIYVGCRGKGKKNMELEKMNIQDLE